MAGDLKYEVKGKGFLYQKILLLQPSIEAGPIVYAGRAVENSTKQELTKSS
jgi:hypothetical protein